jgi:hypothetical protein
MMNRLPDMKKLFRLSKKHGRGENIASLNRSNPVSYEGEIYWQRKRIIHCTVALIFAAVAVSATLFILFIFFGGVLSKFLIEEHKTFSQESILYLFHIQFGAAAAFVLWLLRIVYRVLFAQMYLWADAAERVTAIRTYYKLINTGFTAGEKQILLDVIFRSSSAGLQAKEASSPSIMKIMTKGDA